jgi:branched-chain amino acid transport system substrate-binding protein
MPRGGSAMKRKVLLLALLIVIGFILPVQAAGPVRIGYVAPLTGDYAAMGKEGQETLKMLIADINKGGVIGGRKIELISEDDAGNPQKALAAVQALVKKKVVAVIGSYNSDCTDAMQDVLNDAKIIHLTGSSTAVRLTEKGYWYFFRVTTRDDEQSKAVMNVLEKMNLKKVAILNDGGIYSKGFAEEMQRLFDDEPEMELVFYEAITPGKEDYTEVMSRMKSTDPDIVFYTGYHPEAARLLQAKAKMEWKNVIFMGGDAMNARDLVTLAGLKAVEGFYFLSPPMPQDLKSKQGKQFLKKFNKRFGHMPEYYESISTADALKVVVDSIRTLKTVDTDRLADFIHTKYLNNNGMIGRIYFDKKGDLQSDLHGVYRVDLKGQFILFRLIEYGKMVK